MHAYLLQVKEQMVQTQPIKAPVLLAHLSIRKRLTDATAAHTTSHDPGT